MKLELTIAIDIVDKFILAYARTVPDGDHATACTQPLDESSI
jgi:hypothetical protein